MNNRTFVLSGPEHSGRQTVKWKTWSNVMCGVDVVVMGWTRAYEAVEVNPGVVCGAWLGMVLFSLTALYMTARGRVCASEAVVCLFLTT